MVACNVDRQATVDIIAYVSAILYGHPLVNVGCYEFSEYKANGCIPNESAKTILCLADNICFNPPQKPLIYLSSSSGHQIDKNRIVLVYLQYLEIYFLLIRLITVYEV